MARSAYEVALNKNQQISNDLNKTDQMVTIPLIMQFYC